MHILLYILFNGIKKSLNMNSFNKNVNYENIWNMNHIPDIEDCIAYLMLIATEASISGTWNEVIKKSTIVLWYRWIGQKLTEMHLISHSTISRFHRDEIKQEVDRMAFLFSSILVKEADIDWTWNYIGWTYRVYNILSMFIIIKYFKYEFIINLV